MSNWLALALVLTVLPALFGAAPARAGGHDEIHTDSLLWRETSRFSQLQPERILPRRTKFKNPALIGS